ncbi:MAG: hypothetical protein V3T17_00535 [Pseudomonadales bacterium]
MDAYLSRVYLELEEGGLEALIEWRIDVNGSPYDIVSLNAVGGSQIVYNVRSLITGSDDEVVKLHRAHPGTERHNELNNKRPQILDKIGHLVVPYIDGNLYSIIPPKPGQCKESLKRYFSSYIVAVVSLNKKNFERALEWVDVVLKDFPFSAEALCCKGEILMLQGELSEAYKTFFKVNEMQPQFKREAHCKALNFAAILLHNDGKNSAAHACLDEAIRKDSALEYGTEEASWYIKSLVYEDEGDYLNKQRAVEKMNEI